MNKTIIITACFLFSLTSIANDLSIGRIVEIKGEAFISRDGKTKEVRKGDQLYPNSELVIEHTGQITFTDNADHRFHLGNATSVGIGINNIELRSGDIWFQSLNKSENYQVKTANAVIDYQGGEAILSYDAMKGKTQLMVINGMMKLSNLRTTDLNMSVGEGNFSFVDNTYEEGAPRDPTPVGDKTYKQLVSMFKGVGPMDKKSEEIFHHDGASKGASREIASVHETKHEVVHKTKAVKNPEYEAYKASLISGQKGHTSGKNSEYATYLASIKNEQKGATRGIASVGESTHEVATAKDPEYAAYLASIKKAPKGTVPSKGKTEVVVQIYGQKTAPTTTSARMPASVKEDAPKIVPVVPVDTVKSQETDNLLNALKNL